MSSFTCGVVQEKRFEYSLKSPGIKPMSSRHSTSTLRSDRVPLPSALGTVSTGGLSQRPSDASVGTPQDVDDISSCGATPPLPGTPITPPPDTSNSDITVFANVLLPGSSKYILYAGWVLSYLSNSVLSAKDVYNSRYFKQN